MQETKMKREDIFMKIFGFSRPTYYKWKREGSLAIKLIENNFTDEELIAFIENQNNGIDEEYSLIQKVDRLCEKVEQLERRLNELETKKE